MRKEILISLSFAILALLSSCHKKFYEATDVKTKIHPKREFRGAWMHTVGNNVYRNMTPSEMRKYLKQQLDVYQACGINAIIFQVRPQADAFYKSEIEPWSRYLTGTQGKAPSPMWDPMQFMIEECHKRNMEFHAWLNPYRVTSTLNDQIAGEHIMNKNPQYFVRYGNQVYFQPGEPWSRKHICKVVTDIVKRYDVDAIHMDDYFYPYPIAGKEFPDRACFETYGERQGFKSYQINDWRRNNVDLLIEQLNYAIKSEKPWVKFGISPFGIYRNKKDTPDGSGSETNGLSNYDQLYADVKLWVEKGWIDYLAPQVYWEIGHKAADYTTLVNWWSKNNFGKQLYIGQDISRTTKVVDPMSDGDNMLTRKMAQMRAKKNIHGNVWWSGAMLQENMGGIQDSLMNNYQKYPALVPVTPDLDHIPPHPVKKVVSAWTQDGYMLLWKRNSASSEFNRQAYYAVYRFKSNEKIDLSKSTKIVAITRDTHYKLPYKQGKTKYKYVVSAFDRMHNESKGRLVDVKL